MAVKQLFHTYFRGEETWYIAAQQAVLHKT